MRAAARSRWSWVLAAALVASSSFEVRGSAETKLLTARLSSCDIEVARSATREVLGSLQWQAPEVVFTAANVLQRMGDRDQAAFLSLASLLRLQRQRMFVKGDAAQVLGMYSGFLSGMMMPFIESDPDFAEKMVRRVLEWDRATPDPNLDRPDAKTPEMAAKLADIESVLVELPAKLRRDPQRVAKARDRMATSERMIADKRARDCAPGMLDPKDIPAIEERIKREAARFVEAHDMVKARSRGKQLQASVSSSKLGGSTGVPARLTVSVRPRPINGRVEPGQTFYAEVDVLVRVNRDRGLEGIDYSLACLTSLWVGERNSSWQDVCRNDPAAQRPATD